jgi:hypothetical protein
MPGTNWARGFGFQGSLDQSIRRGDFCEVEFRLYDRMS